MKDRTLKILIVGILIVGAFLSRGAVFASQIQKGVSNNGLIGWWTLDEGTSTAAHDFSGNGNTGTLTNFLNTSGVDSPSWMTGKFGSAGFFTRAKSHYAIASSSAYDNTKSWTLSVWVNLSSTGGIQFVVDGASNSTSLSVLQLMRIKVTGAIDTFINGTTVYSSSGTISTGAWHQLATTWDSTTNTVSFYIDGAPSGSATTIAAVSVPIRDLVFGGQAATFSTSLDGGLDDVRLYQRALSATEIANLYSGTTVSSANLIGWWTFDEGTGYSAADSSGYNQTAYFSQDGWIGGKRGRALAYNGMVASSRYVATSLARASGDGTIAAWFKSGGVQNSTSRGERIIAGQGANTDGLSTQVAWIYLKAPNTENPMSNGVGPGGALGFLWGCPNCNNGAYRVTTANAYTDGKWHQAVMTQSNGTMSAYVDGTLVGTNSASTSIDTSYPFYIGGSPDSSNFNFSGAVDDVRYYSRSLSAAEVYGLYHAGEAVRKTVSNNGLAGYWSFDEGNGTVAHDFSGNSNAATLVNMSTPPTATSGWNSKGKRGQALNFDGIDDYVNAGNAASVNLTGPMTISAWAYYTDLSKTTIASKWGNVSHSGYSWLLFDNWFANGEVNFLVSSNGTTYYNASTPAGAISPGQWYHIVGVYDGSTASVYIDGTLMGSTAASGALHVSSTNFTIGADWDTGSVDTLFRNFKGKLDDVRLYSRALSASEVYSLYRQGQTTRSVSPTGKVTGGLAGYWTFDGKNMNWSTGQVADSSGAGDNGIALNMSTSSSPTQGKLGQALSFSSASTQYVDLGNPASSQFSSGALSIAAWVKSTPNGTHQVIMSHGSGAYVLYLHYQSGTYYVCWASASVANNNCFNYPALTYPADGKWHHIVAVNTIGSSVATYLDGSLMNTTSFGNTYTYANNLRIGYSIGDVGGLPMNGSLDDVRLYNRALTAAEVKQLYLQGK